ncbi:hypothetical protein HGRIS_004642 [Hohenbuehelia grisea]|uniref:Origin recognition complex subunit 6 n=1 Tax=Hohenbuehelia grisea TaxID=104357 RepID=A0ABR3JCH5_9AGAR
MASLMQERQLTSLCSNPETLSKARAILRLAQLKTIPGSGHELGALATGLPAICALLASQRCLVQNIHLLHVEADPWLHSLNYNDVKRPAAQASACLGAKDFTKALSIVQAALDEQQTHRQSRTRSSQSFQNLFQQYGIPSSPAMIRQISDAEETLIRDHLPKEDTENLKGDLKLCLFYWTCRTLKVANFISVEDFQTFHEIPETTYKTIVSVLQRDFVSIKTPLRQAFKKAQSSSTKAARAPVSPTKHVSAATSTAPVRSPLKSSMKPKIRELPSGDALKKNSSLSTAPHGVQTQNPQSSSGSPAKRRKVDPPSEPKSTDALPPALIKSANKSIEPIEVSERHHASVSHPKKRRVVDEPMEAEAVPHVSRSPSRYQQRQSSSHDSMDVDAVVGTDEEEAPVEAHSQALLTSRRIRPVFLDHKQWYRRDPRLNRIWKEAVSHREEMVKLYDHPFEQYRPPIESQV